MGHNQTPKQAARVTGTDKAGNNIIILFLEDCPTYLVDYLEYMF